MRTLVAAFLVAWPFVGPAGVQAQDLPSPEGEGVEEERTAVVGTVSARVDGALRALPGAVVEVRWEGGVRQAAADGDGRYRVEDLPPGVATVRVESLGYREEALEVRIPPDRPLSLDVELEARPLALSGVQVEGRGTPAGASGRVSPIRPEVEGRLAMRVARATSGMAEAGLTGTLREVGSRSDDEPSSALLIRGTSTEGQLVLLDGSPVYTPFHVAGLVPGFERDLLGDADLHVAGAPSHLSGGLSHILDLRTRAPRRDAFGTSGSLDGMAARATVEGPVPLGTSLLLSGRALHGLQPRVTEGAEGPYGYGDLLLRTETELAPGHAITTTGFRNRESVRLEGLGDGEGARWGSATATARYHGLWGGTAAQGGVSRSTYEARLPFILSHPYLASADQDRSRIHLDLARPWEDGVLRYGGDVERQAAGYRIVPLEGRVLGTAGEGESALVASGPLAGEREAWKTGGYVEGRRPLGDEFEARLGLRAEHFSGDGSFRLAPRASLTWSLSESAALTAAAGRFHRYQVTTDLETEDDMEAGARSPDWAPGFAVSTANHLVVSLDQRFSSQVGLSLDGFVKGFDIGDLDTGVERIRTSGLEIRAHREGDRLAGWVGYSLNWIWSQDDGMPADEFEGRHLLNVGLQGRLPGGLEGALTVSYGGGLPLTSIPTVTTVSPGGGLQESDLPTISSGSPGPVERFRASGAEGGPVLPAGLPDDFLRVDLDVEWPGTLRLGERRVELAPYLRVMNALDRRDALFHIFEPWRDDQVRPLAERPILPVFGVRWRY